MTEPTLTDRELLSRLLDADLTEGDAATLRERLADEPELARAWRTMQALPDQLATLPSLQPPAATPKGPARFWRAPRGAGGPGGRLPAVAALAALLALASFGPWLRAPADQVLLAGSAWVRGDVDLLAAGTTVHVDGRAWIHVEPPGGLLREGDVNLPELPTMDRKQVLAALAGAAITVTVYEGRALLSPDDGAPVTVEAGETWSSAEPPERPPATRVRVARSAGADPSDPATLQAENAALRAELAATHARAAMLSGQLHTYQGEPQPWTDDIPEAFRPDAFEAAIRRALGELGNPEALVSLDCSEYPCLALFSLPDGDTRERAGAIAEAVGAEFPEDANASMRVSKSDDDGAVTTLAGLSLTPPGDDPRDDEIQARLGHRMESAVEGLVGGADESDEDVTAPR
jgi:hypothetical protein